MLKLELKMPYVILREAKAILCGVTALLPTLATGGKAVEGSCIKGFLEKQADDG